MPRSFILPVAVLLALTVFPIPARTEETRLERTTLLRSGEGGYRIYRIPAVVATEGDTVLFFCEGRKGDGSDFAETHLLLLRSDDAGRSWSNPQVVWKESGQDVTMGNPCPVYDPQTKTVHLMFTRDNQRVLVTRSDDQGRTWHAPRDISASVTPAGWSRYWVGPGHGLRLRTGPQRGRLLFPAYHLEGEGNQKLMRSHMIYSDDGGQNWQCGASTTLGEGIDQSQTRFVHDWIPEGFQWHGCECMAEQTAGGRVLLIVRNQTAYQGRKAIAWSDDGGQSWSPVTLHEQLPGARCQSSLLAAPAPAANRLLFAGIHPTPRGSQQRKRLTVYLSDPTGEHWPISRLLEPGPASYSDLCLTADGTILCFYESGARAANQEIRLARFNLAWLTNTDG